MGYSLSFAEDFFTDEGYDEGRVRETATITRRPQSVMQAIVSEEKLAPARFRRMVEKVLGYSLPAGQPADEAVFWDLLEAARKHSRLLSTYTSTTITMSRCMKTSRRRSHEQLY